MIGTSTYGLDLDMIFRIPLDKWKIIRILSRIK